MEETLMSANTSTMPTLSPAEQREVIKQDMIGKFWRDDWHGVMDCAADLREHDAYQRGVVSK
jgi:hypothetical protein